MDRTVASRATLPSLAAPPAGTPAQRAAVIGAIVAAACVSACQGGSSSATAPRFTRAGDSATAQLAFGIQHGIVTGGVRRAELRAETAAFNDSGTRAELTRVRLTLLSAAGDSVGAVVAPAGTYDLKGRRVTARGGVTVWSSGGRQRTAPEIVYDGAVGRLSDEAAPPTPRRTARPAR